MVISSLHSHSINHIDQKGILYKFIQTSLLALKRSSETLFFFFLQLQICLAIIKKLLYKICLSFWQSVALLEPLQGYFLQNPSLWRTYLTNQQAPLQNETFGTVLVHKTFSCMST